MPPHNALARIGPSVTLPRREPHASGFCGIAPCSAQSSSSDNSCHRKTSTRLRGRTRAAKEPESMSSQKAKGRWFAYVLLLLGAILLYSAFFWREEARHVYRGYRTYRYQDFAIGILALLAALVGLGVPGVLRKYLTRLSGSRRNAKAVPAPRKKSEERCDNLEGCIRPKRGGAVNTTLAEQATASPEAVAGQAGLRGGPETKPQPSKN